MGEPLRYERKFHSEFLTAQEAVSLVELNSYGFKKEYPDRRISNIYFDSETYINYFQHISGSSKRAKYRVRWYGMDTEEFIPILEIKKKTGLLNSKDKLVLEPVDMELWMKSNYAIKSLHTDSEMLKRVSHLSPVLFNSYKRSYYRSLDREFRVTVDSELEFCDERMQRRIRKRTTIIELKYRIESNSKADQVTNQFPLRLSKYSKYVEGMSQLRGLPV